MAPPGRPPVKTYGNVAWNDKPILAVSNDGQDVYASFNGPTGGDPWVATSHDAGATWSQVKLLDSGRYDYTFDGDVDADGNVYFAISSLLYSSAGKHSALVGADEEHIAISRDKGATWADVIVATSQPGLNCTAVGCTHRLLPGALGRVGRRQRSARLPVRRRDGLRGQAEHLCVTRSTDHGAHWTTPAVISTVGEESTMPMIESGGSGDVRIAFMQTSGGGNVDAWNTWYRRSTDGGATWSAPVRISDATSGAPYKTRGRLRRGLRRLRRDGDHQHRQDHRDLGRGDQLHRPRRRLGQPRALRASTSDASVGVEPSPRRAPTRAASGGSR